MKNKIQLDSYESEILDSIESEEWNEIPNIESERIRFKNYSINTQEKQKEIHLMLNENVFYQFKKKSLEAGIPYQSLINVLIQNYNNGKISISL